MNRRGFFGALVGGVAALATGRLLPEKEKLLQNGTLADILKTIDPKMFVKPPNMNMTEWAYMQVEMLESRVQAATGKTDLDSLMKKDPWIAARAEYLWTHRFDGET